MFCAATGSTTTGMLGRLVHRVQVFLAVAVVVLDRGVGVRDGVRTVGHRKGKGGLGDKNSSIMAA